MARPASLCGAWSLSGEPLEHLLDANRRRAAISARSAVRLEEYVAPRLWLSAAHGCLVRDGSRVATWDGFLVPGSRGPWELSSPPRNVRNAPAGHYVAVQSDARQESLSLTRDPTGGERLYFRREGPVLYFASSLKTLLILSGGAAILDRESALERGVAELVCFGEGTLVDGVSEILPGHRLVVSSTVGLQEWIWPGLLESVEGDVEALGWRLRVALKEAVANIIGDDGRVAVALSGGVDSASVAALAVELLGPERVTAFTYEYQDPDHPSEVAVAADICRRLGIRTHRVVPITFDDFAAAAPEAVWLAEDPGYWKRSYPLILGRAAAADGFDKLLTGFGIGSHMDWFDECARVVPWLPMRQNFLRFWTQPRGRLSAVLPRLHPGLEPPMHRLVYPVLAVLRERGLLKDLRPFFPPIIGELIERLSASSRVQRDLGAVADRTLGGQLQFLAFTHMNSCADVARCERPSREVGAGWIGPAHFPTCLPFCYMPLTPKPALWDSRRRMRPGKRLLLEAMRDTLPDELVRRRKNWSQTIGSRRWRNLVLKRMDDAAGPSWEALRSLFGPALEPAKRHAPEGMIPLAFWHRIFIQGAFKEAPSWENLSSPASTVFSSAEQGR